MANTQLTRSVTTTGNQKTWTISVWVKRSKLGSNQFIFSSKNVGETTLYFRAEDDLQLELYDGNNYYLRTNRLFRDTNAWYHIVAIWDSIRPTNTDRMRLYVNGVQETSFGAAVYPPQNYDSYVNQSGATNRIGNQAPATSNFFDGSMSHFHLIDGNDYNASYFGETDATTGEWKIKTSPSVTYGTNGFFILKDGNSVTDQSGNGNNFTVAGGTLTKTEDCPSNVFPTINPLTYSTAKWNLEYGNLRTNGLASGESAAWRSVYGTLGASSGKYYFEMKVTSTYSVDPNYIIVGIIDAEQMEYPGDNGQFTDNSRGYGYQGTNGNKVNAGGSSYGANFTTNDIIGCAFDLDNHKIYWSKNGVWQNSGDPTSGATGTGSAFDLATGYTYLPAVTHFYDDDRIEFNFGNGYFGTTAISSAGTNASGNGIFEYDVPTGYTALSTKGLNL